MQKEGEGAEEEGEEGEGEEEGEEGEGEGEEGEGGGDPDNSCGFIVFECDDDENQKTLIDEEENTRDGKIKPSLHEDEELKEYGLDLDTDGALAIHKELKAHD